MGLGTQVFSLPWKYTCPVLASAMANPCGFSTVMSLTQMQKDKQGECVSYWNSSYTSWQQVGFIKGHEASRQKPDQEENKLFKTALPQRPLALLHTHRLTDPSCWPRHCHPHGLDYLVAAHLRASNTSGGRKQVLLVSRLFPLAKASIICMLFDTSQATVQKRS